MLRYSQQVKGFSNPLYILHLCYSYNLQITNFQKTTMKAVVAAVILGMVMLVSPSAGMSFLLPRGLF